MRVAGRNYSSETRLRNIDVSCHALPSHTGERKLRFKPKHSIHVTSTAQLYIEHTVHAVQ